MNELKEVDETRLSMIFFTNEAIENLGHAMNLVEANDNYNDGQNEEFNRIYDTIADAWKKLNDLVEGK